MHATVPHLRSAINQSLHKGALCRIYKDSLDACWPGPESLRRLGVAQFAERNRWDVEFREIGALGLVAEFRKKSDAAVAVSVAP